MDKVIEELDHPLLFLLFLSMALLGVFGVATWAFKRAGMPGPAALVQHP